MGNFLGTFETRKRLFISAFPICMTVPLSDFCAFESQCSILNMCKFINYAIINNRFGRFNGNNNNNNNKIFI